MAAARPDLDEAEAKKFRDSVIRLQNFTFRDDEKSKNTLSLLLDELIAVEASACTFRHEYEGSELLAHLSRIVPVYLDRHVAKVCHVIFKLCTQKNVTLATSDLHVLVHFLTESLHQCPSYVYADVLCALCAVCENNTYRIEKFHDVLVGGKGLLLQLTDDTTCEDDVVVEAVRCLAVFTCLRPNHADRIEVRYLSAGFDTFVHLLHRAPHMKMSLHMRNKLLTHCFSGIQNIISIKRLPNIELGILFAAVRAYMFYGLTSQAINIPSQLYPNVVMPYDPLTSSKVTRSAGDVGKKEVSKQDGKGHGRNEAATPRDKNRSKKPRKKKGRGQEGNEEKKGVTGEDGYLSNRKENAIEKSFPQVWGETTIDADSWETTWQKLSSSDSEFSDTEGGRARQQRAELVKVRQCALNCFLSIVRMIDKKVMFGFWSSFIPDVGLATSTPQLQQSLFTAILKDPSPRCRMAAVASLTSMLESTRPYLAAAQEISTHQAAFTPFSTILGSMIREMHRCLLQALAAENYKAVLTQIIKCLANLVNNAPYHRLNPGLLTRVLRQIRHFYSHKDPNVRTACLTCIGAIVGIKPPLMEVSQLIKPPQPPVGVSQSVSSGNSPLFRPEDASYLLYPSFTTPHVPSISEENQSVTENHKKTKDDSEMSVFSRGENFSNSEHFIDSNNLKINKNSKLETHVTSKNAVLQNGICMKDTKLNPSAKIFQPIQDICDRFESGEPPGYTNKQNDEGQLNSPLAGQSLDVATPVLGTSSGMDTPIYVDHLLQAHAHETSWVIKLCINNITGQPDIQGEENQRLEAGQRSEPLPIRLEALQVMSNLIRNYFPVIRVSLSLLQNLIQICLEDSNHIIKLHGVKVLDELTQVLQKDVADASISPNHVIPFQQVLDFWLFLLEGPLPKLLCYNPEISLEGNNLVRSGACECMANIGEETFARLPVPRQMQCVTLVLGLAADEDKLIRASAVRALGIYVMYSSLKEDVAFVLDASKAILLCMECPSNSVRFKAAWSMANLCDTLVNNKDKQVQDFVADFPDSLLLQLMQCAASSTKDSDKISCNAARAIGNLLRYMPSGCFQQPDMEKAVELAVRGLVKNMSSGTMKVRWNSCYAASNAFQNAGLPVDKPWVTDILSTLSKVVQNCTNFKVRINAAQGLATPASRQGYGSNETFSNIWMSLVTALETAENITDFAEYKYKDSLTEHLCLAVLHVTSLVELTDLSTLAQGVHIKGHSFRTYVEKYIKIQLSKRGQSDVPSLEEAKDHLEKLESAATSDDQRRCLQGLLQACVPDTDSADERTPEKTSFQQIYD